MGPRPEMWQTLLSQVIEAEKMWIVIQVQHGLHSQTLDQSKNKTRLLTFSFLQQSSLLGLTEGKLAPRVVIYEGV